MKRRPRWRRRSVPLGIALALGAGLLVAERVSQRLAFEQATAGGSLPGDATGPCRARHVIDGDTVDLVCGGERVRVRMLRIDTPERDEPGHAGARAALRARLAGRDVHLVYETPGQRVRGSYGRLLAYLFADGRNVNVEMVRDGWSRFDTRFGEGRFAAAFREAERRAPR